MGFAIAMAPALAGCAQSNGQAASDVMFESARQSQAAETAGKAELQRRLDAAIAPARDALIAFRTEKRPACTSEHLRSARVEALGMMGGSAVKQQQVIYAWGVDGIYQIAGVVLDVADAARAHHCTKVAREIYDAVIRTYVGSDYAALRQRAEIGIRDLKG
jgi:hypothetical protein